MSWNAPQTWAEVEQSVEAGFSFGARPLGVQGNYAHAVCGHFSTRAILSGHLDDFAHRIIESNDDLHARYMGGMNRWAAQRDDDVTYFVCRDGNALAYITRAGEVVVNERVTQASPRYRNAMVRLMPALQRHADARKIRNIITRGNEVFTPDRRVARAVQHLTGPSRWVVRFEDGTDSEDVFSTDQLQKVLDS